VKDIITSINKDKALCVVFCLYPTYLAGILSRVEEINFYILSNNKLKFVDYIEKCISGKRMYRFSHKYDEYHFRLSSGEDSVNLKFEIRTMDGNLPFELIFAYSIINKIRLSCLTYDIVYINNRVAYIADEVLNSKHECVLERHCSFDIPKRLAGCKLYTKSCLSFQYRIFLFYMLFCTKKSHRKIWDVKCDCKLCVKTVPTSLKSMCVNKLGYFLDN
jgi:hypothetical protein